MAIYAVISNGIVVNTIIAETQNIAQQITSMQCVKFNLEAQEAGIGYSYNGKKFTAPVIQPIVEEPIITTK